MPVEKEALFYVRKEVLKRAVNKFRRKQLKQDEVLKHNRFGGFGHKCSIV